jgi:hypothetical protein
MNLRLGGALLTVAALLFGVTRAGVHYVFMAVAAYSYPLTEMAEQRIYIPSNQEAFTRLQVESAIGRLAVAPGATEILSGTALYNVAEFAPIVQVDQDGNRSQVLMRQQHDLDPTRLISMGDRTNAWDLRVGTAVPFQSLRLFLGAGQGTLDLGGVAAQQVAVFLGTGEVSLAATGAPFLTDELAVFVGTGEAHVDLRQSESISTSVEMGMGEIVLDLRSDWQHDGTVRVNQGLGDVTLILPEEVGVRVHVSGVGDTIAQGVSRPPVADEEKGVYANSAYATSPVTVEVTVERGMGSVRLLMSMPE